MVEICVSKANCLIKERQMFMINGESTVVSEGLSAKLMICQNRRFIKMFMFYDQWFLKPSLTIFNTEKKCQQG